MASYEDDDYYDPEEDVYEEEEDDGLSPEDKISMAIGTEEVQKALGEEVSKVSVPQIQEALWHYFFDVEKSVGYLQRTFISPTPKPTPKKSAPEAAACGGANGAGLRGSNCGGYSAGQGSFQRFAFPIVEVPILPMEAYFLDMPWLRTPTDRHTTFIAPCTPRGGLLGGGDGAPKLSKLQALAAARKKKTQEKELQAEKGLQDLSISSQKSARQTNAPSASASSTPTPMQKRSHLEPEPSSTASDIISYNASDEPLHGMEAQVNVLGQRPTPSAFAQTLIGPAPGGGQKQKQDIFAMSYASSPTYLASAFSEPSPDDVVLAAQAKAGKKVTPGPKAAPKRKTDGGSKADDKTDDIAKKVAGLKVNAVPPPKTKGLDVVKEYEKSGAKKSTSFVVVGHVDAGKSTLMGRLLVDLKYVDQRTVDKYKRQAEKNGKQSFALAWVMDQRSEERERGVTIDIATNYFETDKTKYTILDAPGHRDFVPNMIAGASQADFAILVIDANIGAYEKGLKGQTREHILLLRSLGLQRVIVAVNKLDMVGWSKDRFEDITQEVTGFLTGLGFQDKNVDFVPISGLDGENIVKDITAPAASWYQGGTLLDALEGSEPTTVRALKKPFRMAISEIFRSMQQGTTTLAGRIDSGTIQIGDSLVVQPSGETAYIKSIMVDTDAQDWAVAGQNVSIALTDIDPIHIRAGDILCHAAKPIPCSDTFTIKAMAFEHLMPMPIDLHRGRLHAPGQILSMTASLDKATGEVIKKKPKVIQPGGVARVVIKLAEKVPLEAGQRVVLRAGGETIAAGLLE
ncbi:elongation factor Tu GTP binding domain protein [Cordyceps militaris CM01]|uniref:Elongation factor 1 alpha-like protein n=1 Tax=Cordyceps militaris (strain CM01) TaxID=983644 RepID=G3JHM1_CORMM|nr:elongation factor Tu GTP binding domain protein [Cordyceps militaris CM01]EGX90929.1 elongation factor Tu GTP binding domain protein [Cordyceps militaris CM01]